MFPLVQAEELTCAAGSGLKKTALIDSMVQKTNGYMMAAISLSQAHSVELCGE